MECNIEFIDYLCKNADGFKVSENRDCVICHDSRVFYFDETGELSLEDWNIYYYPYLVFLAYHKLCAGEMFALSHPNKIKALRKKFVKEGKS